MLHIFQLQITEKLSAQKYLLCYMFTFHMFTSGVGHARAQGELCPAAGLVEAGQNVRLVGAEGTAPAHVHLPHTLTASRVQWFSTLLAILEMIHIFMISFSFIGKFGAHTQQSFHFQNKIKGTLKCVWKISFCWFKGNSQHFLRPCAMLKSPFHKVTFWNWDHLITIGSAW